MINPESRIEKSPPRQRIRGSRAEVIIQGIEWDFLAQTDEDKAVWLLYRLLKRHEELSSETRSSLTRAIKNPVVAIPASLGRESGNLLLSILKNPDLLDDAAAEALLQRFAGRPRWEPAEAFPFLEALIVRGSLVHVGVITRLLPHFFETDSARTVELCKALMKHPYHAIRVESLRFALHDHRISGEQSQALLAGALGTEDRFLHIDLVDLVDSRHPDQMSIGLFLLEEFMKRRSYEALARLLDRARTWDGPDLRSLLSRALDQSIFTLAPTRPEIQERFEIPAIEQEILEDVFAYESYYYLQAVLGFLQALPGAVRDVSATATQRSELITSLAEGIAAWREPAESEDHRGYGETREIHEALVDIIEALIGVDPRCARSLLESVGTAERDPHFVFSPKWDPLLERIERAQCREAFQSMVSMIEVVDDRTFTDISAADFLERIANRESPWWLDYDSGSTGQPVWIHRSQAIALIIRCHEGSPLDPLTGHLVQESVPDWKNRCPRPLTADAIEDFMTAIESLSGEDNRFVSSIYEVLIFLAESLLEDLKETRDLGYEWVCSLPMRLFKKMAQLGLSPADKFGRMGGLCARILYRYGRRVLLNQEDLDIEQILWGAQFRFTTPIDPRTVLEMAAAVEEVSEFRQLCGVFFHFFSSSDSSWDERMIVRVFN